MRPDRRRALLATLLASSAQAQLRGHGGPVRAIAIAPDGKTAISGSFDTSAIRWSLERNAAVEVLRFHDDAVNAVAVLPDGRLATAGADGRIALWRPGARAAIRRVRRAPGAGGGACRVARWRGARLRVVGQHGAAVAAQRRRSARAGGPSAERQRRGVPARRQRGERRLRRDAAHLAAHRFARDRDRADAAQRGCGGA